jgi:hypothetical protein
MVTGEITWSWNGTYPVLHFHDGHQECNCIFTDAVHVNHTPGSARLTGTVIGEAHSIESDWVGRTGTDWAYQLGITGNDHYVYGPNINSISSWDGGVVSVEYDLRVKLGTGSGILYAGLLMCTSGGGTWWGVIPDSVG